MDDLMNKVGALIEEHVAVKVDERAQNRADIARASIAEARYTLKAGESEGFQAALHRVVRERDALLADNAHLRDRPSKDEVRRGARALGFWEKLVEALSDGRVEDASFDDVMAKIQTLRDTREEWQARAEDAFANIDTLCNRITVVRAERDEAKRAEASFTAQFDIMRKDRDQALAAAAVESKQARGFRDIVGIVGAPNFITPHSDLVALTVDDVRKLRADRDSLVRDGTHAQHQLKELLSALGLAHFDRNTIAGAIEATRKRDARLVSERDDACVAKDQAIRDLQSMCEKVQALELKLLEVRKAVGEKVPAEKSGFRIGDLVCHVGCENGAGAWGRVITLLKERIEVDYGRDGLHTYKPSELTHKPIEKGDRVRGIHSTFVDVVIGTSDDGCRCHFKMAPFREARFLVAIAP